MQKRFLVLATLGLALAGGSWFALRELSTRAWELRRGKLIALAEHGPAARRPWEFAFEALATRVGSERFDTLMNSPHKPYVAWGKDTPRALTTEERLWVEASWGELDGLEYVLEEVEKLDPARENWGGDCARLLVLRSVTDVLLGRAWVAREEGDDAAASADYADALRLLDACDEGTSFAAMNRLICERSVIAGLRSALQLGLEAEIAQAELDPLLAAMAYDPARAERAIRRDLSYLERAPADEWGGPLAALAYFKPVEATLALAREPLTAMPWVAPTPLAAGVALESALEPHEIEWNQGLFGLQQRAETARVARLALALTAFRARDGRWPATLAELGFEDALRLDPLTGRDVPYSSDATSAVLGPSAWGERVDRQERLDESPYLWVLLARADARE